MKKLLNYLVYSLITLFFVSNASADTIRFWTTEEQPARLAKQNAMAADFWKETGHEVEVIPVSEKDLGKRATAAFAANDLPDVIYHTLQYVLPWAEAGILDVDANDDVVKELGKDTFAPGANVSLPNSLTTSLLASTSKIPASAHGNTYCKV